ncbi:ABC transporter substrate-binding protein [Microbacterium sp. NPDC003461]
MASHSRGVSAATLAGIGILSIVLAGCSTSTAGEGSGDENTLTFASGQQEAAQALIDGFEEANPEYTIKADFIEQDSAYIQQLRTQLSAGTAPDVFKVWPSGGDAMAIWQVAKDGLVAPLDDAEWASDVPENLFDVSSLDGTLYSLPATTGGIGAIYNDQALAEVGAVAPTTWSEVLELCETATSAGKVAYALGNKDAWTAQLLPYALTATLVYGPNPDFTADQEAGEASFSESRWVEALEKVQQMRDAGCFNEGPNGTSYDAQMTLVATGDALGAVHVSQAVSAAIQYADEATTFSLAPMPATDDPAETYVPVAAGINFAINAKAKNPELAAKFLAYIASPEGQTLFAVASNSSPALPADGYEPDAINKTLLEAQESGRASVYPDQTWPNTQVKEEYLIAMQELFNDGVQPAELLQRLDDAFNS